MKITPLIEARFLAWRDAGPMREVMFDVYATRTEAGGVDEDMEDSPFLSKDGKPLRDTGLIMLRRQCPCGRPPEHQSAALCYCQQLPDEVTDWVCELAMIEERQRARDAEDAAFIEKLEAKIRRMRPGQRRARIRSLRARGKMKLSEMIEYVALKENVSVVLASERTFERMKDGSYATTGARTPDGPQESIPPEMLRGSGDA